MGGLWFIYVVVQFYPLLKFYFPLFLGMVMYDNEFETKENKIETKDKIEPQHIPEVEALLLGGTWKQGKQEQVS